MDSYPLHHQESPEAWSLNHWTVREVPVPCILKYHRNVPPCKSVFILFAGEWRSFDLETRICHFLDSLTLSFDLFFPSGFYPLFLKLNQMVHILELTSNFLLSFLLLILFIPHCVLGNSWSLSSRQSMEFFKVLIIIYLVSKPSSLFSECSLFSTSCLCLVEVIFPLISLMIFLRIVLFKFLLQPVWSISSEFLFSACFGLCLLCNQPSSDVGDLDHS